MELHSYKELNYNEILSFLNTAHESIGKTLDLEKRDVDLVNLDNDYGQYGTGFWCLIDHSSIVGTVGVRKAVYNSQTYAEIRRLYISPDYQKQGLGNKLMDYAISFAIENKYPVIRGTTSFDRFAAIHMMESRGYSQIPPYRESEADLFYELPLKPSQYEILHNQWKHSLEHEKKTFEASLILNPVENIPDSDILEPCASFLHGLYNTDSLRSSDEKRNTKIQFSGRENIARDINQIYQTWAEILGAEALTMRLLSGLHAHIVVFMGLTSIGDKVVLLPEAAGGHMATKAILERLGLTVKELIIDENELRIDRHASLELISDFNPDIVFIDRSEGLTYEDFSWLKPVNAYKIFDASQYLTNIMCNDYVNPFDWGFDMILSTLHKNLPGPQRAMICVKNKNEQWMKLRSKISTYVSNMHVFSIYSAGLLLKDFTQLELLSRNMLKNAVGLEQELLHCGLHPIRRIISETEQPTHHLWLSCSTKDEAFELYTTLERLGLMTNYRLLPYHLGYGLRLGFSAATKSGLEEKHLPELAEIIAISAHDGFSLMLQKQSSALIKRIKGKI